MLHSFHLSDALLWALNQEGLQKVSMNEKIGEPHEFRDAAIVRLNAVYCWYYNLNVWGADINSFQSPFCVSHIAAGQCLPLGPSTPFFKVFKHVNHAEKYRRVFMKVC